MRGNKDEKGEIHNSESLKRDLQTDNTICLSFLHFAANDKHTAITHCVHTSSLVHSD